MAAQDQGLGASPCSQAAASRSAPGLNHCGSIAPLWVMLNTITPPKSPAKAPARVTPRQTAPTTSGPAKAAIMPPVPIHTISATFLSTRAQAMAVHASMTRTVEMRLMDSTRRSTAASSRWRAKRGT